MNCFLLTPWFIGDIIVFDNYSINDTFKELEQQLIDLKLEEKYERVVDKSNL